jgi:hypothetical protein
MHMLCQGREAPVRNRCAQAFFLAFLAFSMLLIGGCWNGRLLVAAEQPWWTALGGDALMRWPLARTSLLHGFFPRFVVIGALEDPGARLNSELAARHYAAAVVGPLLSLAPQDYAPAFVSTRFLLVDSSRETPERPNAIPLSFDRVPFFRVAGLAAGLSIVDEEGGTASPAFAQRIAALVSSHPPGTQDELAAFEAGVAQALDGGQPSIHKLLDPIDRNAVRSAIEEMRRDGVEIFLLLMGAADSWALETLKSSGGCAIVSDWSTSGAFPRQVFLSVEAGLVGGVSRFLSNRENGGAVSGPVRIVAGKARPVPSAVAARVQTR